MKGEIKMKPNPHYYKSGSSHLVQQPTVRRNAQRQRQTSQRVPNSADASVPVYNGLEIQNRTITRIDFNKIQVRKVLEYLQHNPTVSIDSRRCIVLLHQIGKLKKKITINLAVIDRIINQLPDNFTNMHIGNAMYGLKNLDGADAATKRLVQALAEKVASSNAVLDAQAIGNALYGLKNLDGTDPTTKRLVQALAQKVAKSKAVLEAQHIGNALYGLQKLDGTDDTTKRLVEALAKKVANSNAVLNAQAIGNAMYGLQKLDGTDAATKRLVQALAQKVANSKAVLEAQHIGNALYGLQNLDGTDNTTKRLVQALAQKVANSKAVLDAQAIGNALYGLQNLDGADAATQYLIKQIMKKTIDSGFINLDKKDMFIKHYSEKNRIDSVIIEFLIAVATSKKLLSLEPTDKVLCISELLHGMTYFCKNEDKAYEGFKYFIKHKDKEGNPIQQTIPFNPYQKPWKLDLHGYIPITGKFAIRYCLESVTINGKKFDEDNDVRTLQIITGQGNHSKRVYSILHQELMDYLNTNYQQYTISSEHGRIFLTK